MADDFYPVGITLIERIFSGSGGIQSSPWASTGGTGPIIEFGVAEQPDFGTITYGDNGIISYQAPPEWDGNGFVAQGTLYAVYEIAGRVEADVYFHQGFGETPPILQFPFATLPAIVTGTSSSGNLMPFDADGDTVVISDPKISDGASFQLLDQDGNYVITPPAGFTGTLQYTVLLSDGVFDRVFYGNVSVQDEVANRPPVPIDPQLIVQSLSGVSGTTSIDLVVTDLDGDSLTFQQTSFNGVTGNLDTNGRLEVTPNAGFIGAATVTYTVTDGKSAPVDGIATIEVVAGENLPPVAPVETITVLEDSGVSTFTLQGAFDPEQGGLVYEEKTFELVDTTGNIIKQPFAEVTITANGTVTIATPNNNENGSGQVNYTVTDNTGLEATGTILVTVEPVNDAPFFLDNPFSFNPFVGEDTPSSVVLATQIAGDTDSSIDDLVFSRVGSFTGGTANINERGQLVYTLEKDYNGELSIPVTVSDPEGASVDADLQITVVPENDDPVTEDLTITVAPGGEVIVSSAAILSNISDVDSQITFFDSVSLSSLITSHGVVQPEGQGFKYSNLDATQTKDQFIIDIDDGDGGSATLTVNVVITNTPSPDIEPNSGRTPPTKQANGESEKSNMKAVNDKGRQIENRNNIEDANLNVDGQENSQLSNEFDLIWKSYSNHLEYSQTVRQSSSTEDLQDPGNYHDVYSVESLISISDITLNYEYSPI